MYFFCLNRFGFPQETVGYKAKFVPCETGKDALIEMENTNMYPCGAAIIPVKNDEGIVLRNKFEHIRNHECVTSTIPEQVLVFRANTDAKLILKSRQVIVIY